MKHFSRASQMTRVKQLPIAALCADSPRSFPRTAPYPTSATAAQHQRRAPGTPIHINTHKNNDTADNQS
jgi:hypothetical protein